jgi:hypothetical protein
VRSDRGDPIAVNRGDDPAVTLVLAHREELHPTGGQEAVHRVPVVGDDLGARGQVFSPLSQLRGVEAVERCGLVQPDEWVGVVPVAARAGVPVHHDDARRGVLGEDHVGERHAHGAGAQDQIVGIQVLCRHCGTH